MTELERVVGVSRTAPTALLNQLREIEPTAELVYVGEGKWWLGKVQQSPEIRKVGWNIVRAVNQQTAGQQATPEACQAHLVGRLRQAGFQFTGEYEGEPDGRIVQDLIVADYLWRLSSNFYRYQEWLNGQKEADAEAARKDLTDPARARDAWRYWRNRTHAVRRGNPVAPSTRTTHMRLS